MMGASLGVNTDGDSDDDQEALATADEDDFAELNSSFAFKRRKLHFQATDSPEQVRGTPSPDNLKGLPPSPAEFAHISTSPLLEAQDLTLGDHGLEVDEANTILSNYTSDDTELLPQIPCTTKPFVVTDNLSPPSTDHPLIITPLNPT
ncbi:hypothetical protein CGRA01v4_15079 [Colletotrichum graminicola]|nr:hypothetical protein CGRA01v4_15079 [Colletotrichum graminicola]